MAKCGGWQYEAGKIFVSRPEVMFLIFSTSLLTAPSHAVTVSISPVHGSAFRNHETLKHGVFLRRFLYDRRVIF